MPITLVKEFVYCPRIAYYKIFSLREPATESMRYAKSVAPSRAQIVETVKKFVSEEFTLVLEAAVESKTLGFWGMVDAVALTDSEALPIEIKLVSSPEKIKRFALHHLAQIVAYAIAVEETYRKPASRALVISLEPPVAFEVRIGPGLRGYIYRIAREFWDMVKNEKIPRATASRRRCGACFYKKFCSSL